MCRIFISKYMRCLSSLLASTELFTPAPTHWTELCLQTPSSSVRSVMIAAQKRSEGEPFKAIKLWFWNERKLSIWYFTLLITFYGVVYLFNAFQRTASTDHGQNSFWNEHHMEKSWSQTLWTGNCFYPRQHYLKTPSRTIQLYVLFVILLIFFFHYL